MSSRKSRHGTSSSDRASERLETFRVRTDGEALRTNQGVKIADNQNSLRAGSRGPSLLEDFIMREKITHFDHERIPERVVHARGSAAHGVFQVYESQAELTRAAFLQDPAQVTPVYVRFSTVQGPRGSADTVRDVRGFATKFYTEEGIFDLVGNNMPIFFIQDAIKFPDFVHAVKPEAPNEMPTGATAHDTFWDFVSLVPESAHMVAWAMSDRAIPKSLRTMEGFGVHTFRLVNAQGKGRFIKWHWRPLLGSYSLVWDEAQKIAGKDPDFHRRDLWEAIARGDYPEFELGVQIIEEEEDENKFAFDLLDPTKLIPEELVPVTILGKMTLNRNPDNFFAETEQVAFHPGHIVPGIDFTNDPLLQGRLFSYTDTQISRLGGPNFHELPINRAVCPFANNQRDAMHRQTINVGEASYEPNSVGNGWPKETSVADGGFESYPERVDGPKIRVRSDSFGDHFSQAAMFYNSMSEPEKDHIAASYIFELGKVTRPEIRERTVNKILANIDSALAAKVADALGLPGPTANSAAAASQSTVSPALSLLNRMQPGIKTRKIALLTAPGGDEGALARLREALANEGASALLVAPSLAAIGNVLPDATIAGMPSIMFDAVFVPGGEEAATVLAQSGDARHFVLEAFKHLKAIGATGAGRTVLAAAQLPDDTEGVCTGDENDLDTVIKSFVEAAGQHRIWSREALAATVPA